MECEMCRLEVPTQSFSDSNKVKHRLCEFCSGTAASNVIFDPTSPPAHYYVIHTILYVGHRIIRELRDLRRELKRDGVIHD